MIRSVYFCSRLMSKPKSHHCHILNMAQSQWVTSLPTNGDKKRVVPAPSSTRILTQLQTEFSKLQPWQLEQIIVAYKGLLPYTWEHHHLYRLSNDVLMELFHTGPPSYYRRAEYQLELCHNSLDLVNQVPKEVPNQPCQGGENKDVESNQTDAWTEPSIWKRGPYFPSIRSRLLTNQLRNYNNVWGQRLGQPLVFDCCYEDYMSYRELKSFRFQMRQCVEMNASSSNPFNITLANVPEDPETPEVVDSFTYNNLRYNCTSKCMTELYPKEKLIMLSPHSPYIMEKFEADKIYIIGGFVDMGRNPLQKTISTDKRAKEFGIKSYQFPLDCFVKWGSGSKKELTLNTVINVLLELRAHGDWKKAFAASLPGRFQHRSKHGSQLIEDIKLSKTNMLHSHSSKFDQRTRTRNSHKNDSRGDWW